MPDVLTQLAQALRDRYRVERELGAGGMATVYLAHDLRHERSVAIKVLHPDLAAALGAERFLSEIKTTAKLQHPHILALIESGDADGLLYYVMPFVEGETLRLRLAREHQLPIDVAVRLAREIASALDYAHRHGVIHRDIKPENVLLHDGSALVADFGIALAVSAAGGARMTQTGLSLGTPQYMSPEQAMGERTIDARADIYALGAVTYEMLAGEAPFTGPTVQAIVARVITEQPRSLSVQRRSVPSNVEAAVMRALEKLPADRFGAAKEFGDALADAAQISATRPMPTSTPAPVAARPWYARPASLVAAASIAAVAAAAGWLAHRPARVALHPIRFTIALPTSSRPPEFPHSVALSRDGSILAFSAHAGTERHIFVREMDQLEARAVPGSEGAFEVAVSPDGKWLAYTTESDIRKLPVSGGTATTLGKFSDVFGLSWATGETLVFSRGPGNLGSSLWRLNAAGGAAALLLSADSSRASWPIALPDGTTIIYASLGAASSYSFAGLGIFSMATGRRSRLDIRGFVPLGIAGNYLVYARSDGTLMAVAVDIERQRLLGAPLQLPTSVLARNGPNAALSASGTLAYVGGAQDRRVLIRDALGRTRTLIDEPRAFTHPRLSPDGRRLAVEIGIAESSDIWLYELASHTLTRLTTGGSNQRPE